VSDRFILAQISDLHIGAPLRAGRENSSVQLQRALAAIAPFRPDAILATGDLANDEKPEEYAELAQLLATPPAPVFLLPGNHDKPALLRQYFPAHEYLPAALPSSYVIDQFPVRIVMIDQTAPGQVGGSFTDAHASWLEATLASKPDAPTIVALHHPPFPSHDRLFDTIGLEGAGAFAAVIARHPQVGRIVCGHHHRLVVGAVAHAPVVTAPSTAWTYGLALHADDQVAPITQEPPGFLLHVWTKADGFATHLVAF
jgi:3',5'-cyclic-AMP phosphodiesterase